MPSSPEGKARAYSNVATDRPSSKFELPNVLVSGLVDQCYERLRAEWKPSTPTEKFLVRELARHECSLQRVEQIEAAVLRRGSRGTPMTPADLESGDAQADAALAAAGITDALERISKYRRLHERAYHKSLGVLIGIRTASAAIQTTGLGRVQGAFRAEAECQTYLIARDWRCPRCGCATSRWIPSRKVREYRDCGRQTGLRAGTVMARSGLSLVTWFRAIAAILGNPDLSTAELAKATGIRREGTIRRVAKRIREAMRLPDSTQLVGRDRVFLQPREESGH